MKKKNDKRELTPEEKKKKEETKKRIIKLVVSSVIIAGLVLAIYFTMKHFGLTSISRERIQNYIKGLGVWGPLAFIFISFLQVTFVPIPGAITIIAGTFLFDVWLSFLYSYIGMMTGSLLAFFLGRWIGRPFVNWVAGDKETVDEYLNKLKGKENVVLFFMFLFPFFPDDLLCAVAGILPLSWFGFALMQVVTRATSILGTILFMSGTFIPYHGWGLAVIIVLCILAIIAFLISYKYSTEINNWFTKFTSRFVRKKKEDNTTLNNEVIKTESSVTDDSNNNVDKKE